MKNILKIFTVLFLTLNIMPSIANDEKQQAYDDAYATEQSKANRLLTSASSAATGIGGMELAQGLSEQKADRTAEQGMSAYISTMRCEYGNGKSVKAGMDEIELPGGNDSNLMKYRAEYMSLSADLKERKTALGLKPGIESEEILDKSQMGLYDDSNVGINGGRYASLYRAQMLGSETDQEQIDSAKQTSKARVIGGAVAAGVGVVGGIVGDELINQSLSSSTKTATTCTNSGGTWQGGRCNCPDGFIQHTKTGPCFEEQQDQGTITPPQGQDNIGDIYEDLETPEEKQERLCRNFDGEWKNGQCFCTQNFTKNNYINCVTDNVNNPETRKNPGTVNVSGINFENDEFEETDEIPDEAVQYEKQKNCTNSNGEWKDGVCTCKDKNYTLDASGKCVMNFGGANIADKYTKPTVVPAVTQKAEQNKANKANDNTKNQDNHIDTNIDNDKGGDTKTDNSQEQQKNGANDIVISQAPTVAEQELTSVKAGDNNFMEPPTNTNDNDSESTTVSSVTLTQSDNVEQKGGNANSQETKKQQNNLYEENCKKNNGTINSKGSCICPDGSAANINGDCLGPDIFNDNTCEEEGPDYQNNCVCTGGKVNPKDGSCSCPNNQEPNFKGSCPKSDNQQRQVIPRQQQKSTPPRANITNGKTTNNNNDLSKQDMSKNGTFAKAYGIDSKCSVYQNKSWADKSTSWCDDLYKGEWKVQFDYGLVRGKTACDTDGGAEKRLGTPAGKAGQYCWCKVTQYTPNGGAAKNLSLSWMYNKGDSSKGSCEYHCALWCASDIRTDPSIRQKMFNAK